MLKYCRFLMSCTWEQASRAMAKVRPPTLRETSLEKPQERDPEKRGEYSLPDKISTTFALSSGLRFTEMSLPKQAKVSFTLSSVCNRVCLQAVSKRGNRSNKKMQMYLCNFNKTHPFVKGKSQFIELLTHKLSYLAVGTGLWTVRLHRLRNIYRAVEDACPYGFY